ncbi:hypothetical protein K8R43_03750 [archaeon]|nr:hypothetical protein [archaeon]
MPKSKAFRKLVKRAGLEHKTITARSLGKFGESSSLEPKGHFAVDITNPVKTFCEPLGIKVKEPVFALDLAFYVRVWNSGIVNRLSKEKPPLYGFYMDGISVVSTISFSKLKPKHFVTGAHETIHSNQFLPRIDKNKSEAKALIANSLTGEEHFQDPITKKFFQLSMFTTPKHALKHKISLTRLKKELEKEQETAMIYFQQKTGRKPIPSIELSAMTRKTKKIKELLGEKTEKNFLKKYLKVNGQKQAYKELGRANAVLLAGEHILKKAHTQNRPLLKQKIIQLIKKQEKPLDLYWEILTLQAKLNKP